MLAQNWRLIRIVWSRCRVFFNGVSLFCPHTRPGNYGKDRYSTETTQTSTNIVCVAVHDNVFKWLMLPCLQFRFTPTAMPSSRVHPLEMILSAAILLFPAGDIWHPFRHVTRSRAATMAADGAVCEPVRLPMCLSMPYNVTQLPNMLFHSTQLNAGLVLEQFQPLVDTGCGDDDVIDNASGKFGIVLWLRTGASLARYNNHSGTSVVGWVTEVVLNVVWDGDVCCINFYRVSDEQSLIYCVTHPTLRNVGKASQ